MFNKTPLFSLVHKFLILTHSLLVSFNLNENVVYFFTIFFYAVRFFFFFNNLTHLFIHLGSFLLFYSFFFLFCPPRVAHVSFDDRYFAMPFPSSANQIVFSFGGPSIHSTTLTFPLTDSTVNPSQPKYKNIKKNKIYLQTSLLINTKLFCDSWRLFRREYPISNTSKKEAKKKRKKSKRNIDG